MGRDLDEQMKKLVALLIALFVIAGCGTRAAQNAAGGINADQGDANPAVDSLPSGSQQLSLDTSVGECIGDSTNRLAVLSVAKAMDFHAVFPTAALTPELEKVGALVIVTYEDGWPGIVLRKPGVPHERQPNTWDICVRTADGSAIEGLPFIVYGDIPMEGSPLKP